jgi:hypothetical protein
MATRRVQGKPEDYPLQPAPYWTFNGCTLKEIYDDVYVVEDEGLVSLAKRTGCALPRS